MPTYIVENIDFENNIITPSTVKGSMLVSNGEYFEKVAPSSNGQSLIANSVVSSGVEFTTDNQNISYNITNVNLTTNPATSTRYFLEDNSTRAAGVTIPASKLVFMSVTPITYLDDTTRLNGGSLNFTLGRVPANTNQSSANFTAYTGSFLTIPYTGINTVPTAFNSFTASPSISTSDGDQVCIRIVNTFTTSGGGPITWGGINIFSQFITI